MFLASVAMLVVTLLAPTKHSGNAIPGLAIATLGLIANTAFWIRFTRLNRTKRNAILRVQSRLYRAKSLVDGCVTVALLSVIVAPNSSLSHWLDFSGALSVAAYLGFCGVQTILEARRGSGLELLPPEAPPTAPR